MGSTEETGVPCSASDGAEVLSEPAAEVPAGGLDVADVTMGNAEEEVALGGPVDVKVIRCKRRASKLQEVLKN